ncbi:hypothetical protein, partial [uncultured Prevotella sp.]|uniref:hypothetical protein n=1 Tax=uncultured Prevotella sp. TaxID=159272 RepID=UPI00260EA214
ARFLPLFTPNHRFATNIAILRASSGRKKSEIFTNTEACLSEERRVKSEKSNTLVDYYSLELK